MEIRVLGTLEVDVDGVPVELRATKVRATLAMLALHPNQVVSAERLAEGLWGEARPPSAVNTLQGYISQLRRTLGREAIVTRAPGYLLAVPVEAVDSSRFERLVVEGRGALAACRAEDAAVLLDRGLALWRGSALDEFAYEPFAQSEAVRLEELRLVATEEMVEAKLGLGRHAELVGGLRALVDSHPLRERLWGQLMRALYGCGRQADALRTFSELRRRLGEELGIEPSVALQRLEEAMLVQKPELEWRATGAQSPAEAGGLTARRNLPTPRSSFVGRDEELAEVGKLMTSAALVTLVGPGGSGKSRLALEVARQVVARFPGGVWLVELAPVCDPALVPQAVAAAVGVREEPGQTLSDTLATALDHSALLVLDNCEHLGEASASLVDTLVRGAPSLNVLATSREPLRVDGEVIWRIPSLAVPEDDSAPAEALLDHDAVRLFVERASAQGNYAWGPATAATVARICRRLDGLPLAIELAAARTGALAPSVIAERLDDRFELLIGGLRTALPRHRTLRATVDWSYELLSERERVVFRRLSVFAGGFTMGAAQEVCADHDLGVDDVLDLVATLVDRSLISIGGPEDDLRFGIHETLRAYAAERLAQSGEEDSLRARHLAWVLAFAELYEDALAPEFVTQKETLDRVEREHDNIRQALTWALAADTDAALRLAASIGDFWFGQAYLAEGRRWNESVIATVPQGDPRQRAVVSRRAGELALQQGDVGRGRVLVEDALAAFRDLGDLQSVAIGLEQLIWPAIHHDRDWGRAEELARQALAIQTTLGNEHMASEATMLLAWLRLRRGDDAAAQQLMERALGYNLTHATDPCPYLRSQAGHIALLKGDLVTARTLLEEALRHSREAGHIYLARELGWLAEVALLEGDVDEAERLFADELSTARELGLWASVRHSLLWLAVVAMRRGDLSAARSRLQDAQRMLASRGSAADPQELEVAATLLEAEARLEEAARVLGTAEALREAVGEPIPPAYRQDLDGLRSRVADGLGSETFTAAWTEGRQQPVQQAPARVS